VIEALEGPISLNRCLGIRADCPHSDTCAVAPVLRKAQAQLLETLDAATFDELAQESLALRAKRPEQTA
jgi:DNA-binding IscR family transcriptional regulator